MHGVGEITLLCKLKTGLVPIATPMTYASRLRTLLTAYFSDRKRQVERDRMMEGVLESLQIIHSVRWALLEDDTKLLLSVTFDGPWEAYIRLIVEKAGGLLDSIFCHADDYAAASCADGYPKFSAWVRKNQVAVDFLYDSSPDLSVDDVRYLKRFESTYAAGESLANLKLPAIERLPALRPEESAYSLFRLSQLFPDVKSDGERFTDAHFFSAVARLILKPDLENLLRRAAAAQALAKSPQAQSLAPTPEERAIGAWICELTRAERAAERLRAEAPAEAATVEDRDAVQGNILASFSNGGAMTHGAVVLLRFEDAGSARAFLEKVQALITWETSELEPDQPRVSFGLTAVGLRQLGIGLANAGFPREFIEGMAARAGSIGDVGLNNPDSWRLPELNWPPAEAPRGRAPLGIVDAILVVQTRSEVERAEADDHQLLEGLRRWLDDNVVGSGVDILHVQPTRHFDGLGHLRAIDGVSQPVAYGEPLTAPYAARDVVPVGDLLLGYRNSHGEAGAPSAAIYRNSTFIALRKMEQNVKARDAALPDERTLLLALGRGSDGESALRDPHKTGNDFDYGADPDGKKCPLFSHVRRAHPRDPHSPSPRILRRGMSYGPRASAALSAERGVMFMAIAASLADQYEVVQRWVNGGNSTGLSSAHADLIAGTHPANSGRLMGSGPSSLTVPPEPLAILRWGLYAFVPSRGALAALARPLEAAPGRGDNVVELRAGNAAREPATAPAAPLNLELDLVKAQIEDRLRPEGADRYWRKVLESGGAVHEPHYGVMVGGANLVDEVLRDDRRFSVRGYHERMVDCQATLYLGMDPDPVRRLGDQYEEQVKPGDYKRESSSANAFIDGIQFKPSFAAAYRSAQAWLAEQLARGQGRAALARASGLADGRGATLLLDLRQLSARVMRDVACSVFGLPDTLLSDAPEVPGTEGELRCPVDFTQVFQYVFPPRPSEVVSAQAGERGAHIHRKVAQWIEEEPLAAERSALISALRGTQAPGVESTEVRDYVVRTTIGVISGFVVPTHGTLQSVLVQLVRSDRLWRLQRQLHEQLPIAVDGAPEKLEELAPLDDVIYGAMAMGPVPELVHRTAVIDSKLGKQDVPSGELLALNLGAAAREAGRHDGWKYLFGDAPEQNGKARPVHACPGQKMAFGVMAGALCAVLGQPGLTKVDASPFLLRLAGG